MTTNEKDWGRITEIPQPNLRHYRAMALTAQVMRVLDDVVPRDVRKQDIHDALMDLFMFEDVDIVTKADRISAGLPERNEFGLSPMEQQALDLHRATVLSAPPPPLYIVKDQAELDALRGIERIPGGLVVYGKDTISKELAEQLAKGQGTDEG